MNLSTLRSRFKQKVFRDPSDSTVSDSVIDGYLNEAIDQYLAIALQYQGNWQLGQNYATASLVEDQNFYIFPSDLIKINEVYAKVNGEYVKCQTIDPTSKDIDLEELNPSTPRVDLSADGFYIYMENIENVDEGLKIMGQFLLDQLTEDTDTPNMLRVHQPFLYLHGASEYCEDAEMYNKAQSINNKLVRMRDDIETYFANRGGNNILTFKKDNYF